MGNGKILISGTGRCGTTFLMILFTFLKMDTGFTITNFNNNIFKNCNSGMEKLVNDPHKIIKCPGFIEDIESIITKIAIEYMIIPIRDYTAAAASRASHGKEPGGLWGASNEKEQVAFFHGIMANYLRSMVKHNIPTIFLDFDKMVSNESYLYQQLKPVLGDVTPEQFHMAYLVANVHQKKRVAPI